MKKEKLNQQLYKIHLKTAQEWGNAWPTILDHINDSIRRELTKKHKTIDLKLSNLIKSKTSTPPQYTKFYPRVVSKTDIAFNPCELDLLNKGLKYNISFKRKKWMETLALEAETAISKLPTPEQDHMRYQVAHNIKLLYKQQYSRNGFNTQQAVQERRTINNIKKKLTENNAVVLKADKGNSMVIIHADEYHNKIRDFITTNKFSITNNDLTNNFQKQIRHTVNNCSTIIPKDRKWLYTSLNPSAPVIRGLPKIHKDNIPIRPVINWKQAPAYKLAKFSSQLLQTHIPLPNTFNVKNSLHLMNDLMEIPYQQDIQLVSFDIENMYSNIPTNELYHIIRSRCFEQRLEKKLTDEILSVTHAILQQNYFQFQDSCYVQKTGLAMGAPTSSILSEFYLQHMEQNKIFEILTAHNVLGLFRYVDDILIVFNSNKTNIHEVFNSFNKLSPTLKFTMEAESNNQINFLDITIQKETDKFTFNMYRKPTATDTIIPRSSCHPPDHKQAAIRYMVNRLNTYNLTNSNKIQEHGVIRQILHSNGYDPSVTTRHNKRKKPVLKQNENKWAKFTYIGKETKFITKLFRDSPIQISYTTNNTISKILSTKQSHTRTYNRFHNSGIYRLTCPDCGMKYVGQTGRPFHVRFQEHFRDFKYNNSKSKFATHLLENNHSIGPINDIMEILYTTTKGRLMDTIEKFHIYDETQKQSN
jgi:transposase-like protein